MCPDICPDELIKMAAAVDELEEKDGLRITPVFISVDPERDSFQVVSGWRHRHTTDAETPYADKMGRNPLNRPVHTCTSFIQGWLD